MSLPEPSRRERKKDETRRRIFEAALALFRRKGFDATTVDDITEQADVARGTFFNYFPRKEAVFAYMAEEQVATLEESLPALLSSGETTHAVLARVMQLAAERYLGDRELSRMVFTEWIKRDVSPPAETEANASRFMHDVLERGRERGEIRVDVDDERASAVVKGVFLATLFEWLYGAPADLPRGGDVRRELGERLRIVLEGISPRKEVRA